ncbi:hypothetical protein ETD83_36895 [Actinomadura soli]|uniref:Uncharacterized protein n=1 Tax=Actinomadura soli TaxID=2508997 RepID=A0A5C4J0E2_9ACTN|nr:hypothetical protein [Actinomadura soli]TMQ90108.1 hypothetical protein ETD83_36895 [Actinomadura soli]
MAADAGEDGGEFGAEDGRRQLGRGHAHSWTKPFGHRHLRMDCAEQADTPPEQQELAWRRFTTAGAD